MRPPSLPRTIGRLLLAAVLSLGGSPALPSETAPVTGTPAPRVLFVANRTGPDAAVDDRIRAHLQARGFTVSPIDPATPAASVPPAELVVISSTVAAKEMDRGWRHLAVPLLTWENDLLDDLAMTGKRHDVDFGETGRERHLWIVNAPHPMAGGLPAGVVNVHRKQAPMSWGRPGLGATTIATVYGQPEKAALFGYEKGATMDYESLAPARRVMVFLDNATFDELSPEGLRLFDAAIDWAVGRH